MVHEIEAKLRYDRHEDLKKVLEGQSASFTGSRIQRDAYYDDESGTLAARGIALRLREERDTGNPAATRAVITFKGPLEDSKLKKRAEVNLEVAGGEKAELLLMCLCYHRVMVIEKKRSTWNLTGCEIALDELPLIGRFVEIEGPDEAAVDLTQQKLGLSGLVHIPLSYTRLIAAEVQRRGLDMTDATFDQPA
jgi:adenylate cyclase, class 2